jgi:hypothetical protein
MVEDVWIYYTYLVVLRSVGGGVGSWCTCSVAWYCSGEVVLTAKDRVDRSIGPLLELLRSMHHRDGVFIGGME